MSEVGNILGQLVTRVNNLEGLTQKKGSINTLFTTNWFKLLPKCTKLKVEYKDDTGFSVVGHPTLGTIPWKVGANTGSWTTHAEITDPTMLTDIGRTAIAKYINAESPNRPIYIAWGSLGITYNPSQTILSNEIRRILATPSSGGTAIYNLQIEFPPDGNTYEVEELGMFDASSSGNMWYRQPIPPLSVTANLRVRVTFEVTYEDASDVSSASLITNFGLDHFIDYLVNDTPVFDYLEYADGTTDPSVTNTSLDGTNKQRNQISTTTRNDFKTEKVSLLALNEFNGFDMNKIGNFVLATGDNLVTETLLPTQTKRDTFKVRNTDIFEIVTDFVEPIEVAPNNIVLENDNNFILEDGNNLITE